MESKLESNLPDMAETYPRPKARSMPTFEVIDDVVISGIAGRFPESDNMDEFANNLFNNIDMVVSDDRRWPTDLHDGVISRGGKLKELDKFDCSFFSTLTILTDAIDVQSRLMLETTYEAICDAGVNPQTMRGSNTGVYVAINTVACGDGIPQDDFQDCRKKDALSYIYGSAKTLYANRISFLLDFKGPSNLIDTACSASLVALVYALNDIRNGVCDQAIVSTANLTLAPFSNLLFQTANILSPDGKCKVWDKRANGYVRSETVGSIFLQKKSDAKRIYATVLHAKTNTDGFKSLGFFVPYWLTQRDLMISTYQEAGVDPNDVKYFESHGTGTRVGDPQEVKAIAEAFCSKQREDPLLIGAVKSNMGHSEGSSGLNALAKVIITFENQCIPANLHFQEANPELEAIVKGILVPVVKNTPFSHKIIGINSFGIGGTNANVLLKSNDKVEREELSKIADIIPRLVNVCGRTEEAVKNIFDFIENNPNKVNREFLALLTDVMKSITIKGSSNFPYRGYMIIKEKIDQQNAVQYEYSRTTTTANNKQSVWLVFTGMGSQWTAMAKTLMPIKTFANSIKRSAIVLKPYNIDLMHILLSDDQNALKMKITNPFVALTSMQIALYDVIRLLNLKIDGIIGHSFGEIACAYVDGCLTQEQAVLTAYWRGKVVENANKSKKLPKGMLAAVGLTWEEIKKRCPEGIVPACHNGSDSVTVSGLYDNMLTFLDQLNSENIFAKPVTGGGFPYHSKVMNIVAPQLLDALNCIIRNPKQRSNKWISTSFPPEEWHQEMAKYASGEYFTNNLISPVYFSEAMNKIEKDSLVIEVAPHSYFESIFKSCYPSITYSCLMKKTESDNLNHILSSIGTLYTYGLNPDIENLYPRIEWPVSRGTQSISSLIKWDHERINEVKKYPEHHNFSTASDFKMKFSLMDPDWSFLKDHAVDGKVLFPATAYLLMVWRRMAALKAQPWKKTPVVIENVRFFRATFISEKDKITFTVRILEGTGDFTITERSTIVCTGKVYIPDETPLELQNNIQTVLNNDNDDEDSHQILLSRDIYKELRIRGYDYGPKFQGLVEASSDAKRGKAKWTGHVISFIDSIMHLAIMAMPIRALFVPLGFQCVRIDPNVLFQAIEKAEEKIVCETRDEKKLYYYKETDTLNKVVDTSEADDSLKSVTSAFVKDSIASQEIIECDKKLGTNILGPKESEQKNHREKAGKKISILPVSFDWNMLSTVTRGVEISGFIPVNKPRRAANKGLLLEKHVFVANNEKLAIDKEFKDEIIEYIEVCCSLTQRLSKITDKISKPVFNGYKCADESTVNRYLDSPANNRKILKLLKKLVNNKSVDENQNIIKDQIETEIELKDEAIETETDINFDLLKTVFINERLIRPLLDTVIDNLEQKYFKVLEYSATNAILATNVMNTLRISCAGYVNVDYTVATPTPSAITKDIKSFGLKVNEWNISEQGLLKDISSVDLLIYRPNTEISNCITIEDQIKGLRDSVKENGFILLVTRNVLTPPEVAINELYNNNSNKEILRSQVFEKFIEFGEKYNLKVIAKKSDSLTSTLVLLRKLKTETTQPEIINITFRNYEQWVNVLKQKIAENRKANNKKNLWLVANDTSINGIIGLSNCLRKESGGESIRCIFDCDNTLPLPVDFTKSPYNEVIKFDLSTNIYKDGEWGTLRHICLPEERETVMTEHAYLNIETPGDMSSLKWFDAQHKYFPLLTLSEKNDKKVICNIYYSALNFKDVVLLTGRVQSGPESALTDCLIGLEFAGRRSDNGDRVIGMVPYKGIATTILTKKDYLWDIPDEWTLEEAATVPIVYTTAYYALIMRANLVEGESVLIHSGAGGVGQAAINICQSLNCEIFVTVGNQEKRDFIKNTFNIDDTHIGNSRDTSFEKEIMAVTKGIGVDVVLNSLTEDKLQASVRCLAMNGRFLEIGKYDMQMNKNLSLFAFLKNISFHGVGLDCVFTDRTQTKKFGNFMKQMTKLMTEGIANNVVKPIVRTVFEMNECEHAFRYMTTGKHIGKVLIKIRDEESEKSVVNPIQLFVDAITKTWFHPSKVYIIIGGLGGMGLEFAYWMILRGAKKLVITSRSGIKNSYQKWILKKMKEYEECDDEYKIEIKISINDAITMQSANSLIDEANRMGSVGGIFNLALVLRDDLIQNQTVETFKEVCEPKIDISANIDAVTQEKCPHLDYFVCFSSLTCGRGNSGQTNYGYANSTMERICELRRNKGLHGLAVQFGPIGDVGIFAERLLDSSLSTEESVNKEDALKLYGLLVQRITSCFDVLDRYLQCNFPVLSSFEMADIENQERKSEDQMLKELCEHLNIDKRSDDETLGDVGLDSMMAVEIQQILERDYDIALTITQIRKISVAEFKEFRDSNKDKLKQFSIDAKKAKANMSKIRWDVANDTITFLNDIKTGKPVFLLPPVEGIFDNFKELVAKINRPVIGINWTKQLNDIKDFKKLCAYFKQIIANYSPDSNSNELIVHSFGALIGFHLLRKQMPIKSMVFLDSFEMFDKTKKFEEKEKISILLGYLRSYIPERIISKMHKEVMETKGEEARVTKIVEMMKEYGGTQLVGKDFEEIIRKSFERADIMIKFLEKYMSKVSDNNEYLKKRMIKRMAKKTEVTVIKLTKKVDLTNEKIEENVKQNFGFTKEQFDGTFNVHIINGSEAEFLTTHVHKVADIVNDKLA